MAARNGFVSSQVAKAGYTANALVLARWVLWIYTAVMLIELKLPLHARAENRYSRIQALRSSLNLSTLHTAIEACKTIRCSLPRYDAHDILLVRITVGGTMPSILVYNQPKTALKGKFSINFCAAVALYLPPAGPDKFTSARLTNPGI